MKEYLDCYLACIIPSSFNAYVLISLFSALLVLFSLSYVMKRVRFMIYGQGIATLIILTNLILMRGCDMFKFLWVYASIVIVGVVILFGVRYNISKWVKEAIAPPAYIKNITEQLKVDISILNWPGVSAFTFRKRIFLTTGLLQLLNFDEIKAVIAHETYHVNSGNIPIIASFVGITSLTFVRYKEEFKADEFAAKLAGADNLINALNKMKVKDRLKRIDAIDKTISS